MIFFIYFILQLPTEALDSDFKDSFFNITSTAEKLSLKSFYIKINCFSFVLPKVEDDCTYLGNSDLEMFVEA